jgi:hypothetical protein
MVAGILVALFVDMSIQNASVVEAKNEQIIKVPKEVRIEVLYNSKESIERHIREVFHEEPNTAVAIAKCESGLVADIQSHHTLSYGREESFGIFQIHAKDHDNTAKRLGLENYRASVEDNVAMARFLYDNRGNFNDWSCYKNGDYKKHL